MYADYTCYNSGKSVLWGGHSGNLRNFELLTPVIRRPVPALLREYGVRYVLMDGLYACPKEVGLEGHLVRRGSWDSFDLYEVTGSLTIR
jgi:hypothetical protein